MVMPVSPAQLENASVQIFVTPGGDCVGSGLAARVLVEIRLGFVEKNAIQTAEIWVVFVYRYGSQRGAIAERDSVNVGDSGGDRYASQFGAAGESPNADTG